MIREGGLDIIPYGNETWDVIFVRYDWRGGALSPRHVVGLESLVLFLKEQIGLTRDALSEALSRLGARESASLPNVFLSDEKRLELGLVSPNEGITAT
jgi:hypothetical protein